ncbi:MAG: DUF5018 domain-containing protein [Tidjanibacter sp.]|nr:DUF5018 domain-containing protein [Tidjanibacter sp.]
MKKVFAIVAIVACALACEPEVQNYVKLADAEQEATLAFGVKGGEKTVVIATDAAWTATADQTWLTVEPASGAAGEAVELTVSVPAENTSYDNLSATITIAAGNAAPLQIAVTQLQTDEVNVGELEVLNIGYEGGEVELPVNANIEYEITSDADWAVVEGTRGLTTTKHVIKVAKNLTGAERTATISLEADGVEIDVFVKQSGKAFSTTVKAVLGEQVSTFTSGTINGSAMVSIAAWGDKLVVCPGNGKATKLLNKKTGEVVGDLKCGDFIPYYVETDDAGNLLVSNRNLYDAATSTWTVPFQVYYMTSETATPVKLIDGAKYGPLGAAFEVRGNVTKNAVIVAPYEGIEGITGGHQMEVWQIADGKVGESIQIKPTGYTGIGWIGGIWHLAPNNFPAFALLSENVADGGLFGFYDPNILYHIDGTTFAATPVQAAPIYDWQRTLGSIDIRPIKGAPVAAVVGGDFHSEYGATSSIYVINAATKSVVSTLQTNNQASDWVLDPATKWYTFWASVNATVDVCVEPIADGAVVYYIDNNHNSIEGLVVAM